MSLEEEKARLDSLGIVHAVRYQQDLDEATRAYKDIHSVMKNQEDLVQTIVELPPIAVIKV